MATTIQRFERRGEGARLLGVCLGGLVLLVSGTARAGADGDLRGVEGYVSFGPSFPAGAISGASGDAMGSSFGAMWLVGLGLGWRFSELGYLGFYTESNIIDALGGRGSSLQSTCSASGARCHTGALHLGGEVRVHLTARRLLDVWVGVAAGYERAAVVVGWNDLAMSGPEGRLQVGVEYQHVGLFAGLSVGRFDNVDASGTSTSIASTGLHEWVGLGVRCGF